MLLCIEKSAFMVKTRDLSAKKRQKGKPYLSQFFCGIFSNLIFEHLKIEMTLHFYPISTDFS